MVFETVAMLLCTGKLLVCMYWIKPKMAPIAQIAMPINMSVCPVTPPNPEKVTLSSLGICRSASLAKAPPAPASDKAVVVNNDFSIFM